MENIYSWAGNYSTEKPRIILRGSDHKLPPANEVPGLVEEMCNYVNTNWDDASALHLAAYVMWRINWIHPFRDGNGRTVRAVSNLVMCSKLGYWLPGSITIPKQIEEERTPYYRELSEADKAYEEGSINVSKMENLLGQLLARQLVEIHKDASKAYQPNDQSSISIK